MTKDMPEDIIKSANTVPEIKYSMTDRFAPLTDVALGKELAEIDVLETALDQLDDEELVTSSAKELIGVCRIIRTLRIKSQDMWKVNPEASYDKTLQQNPDAKAWADFFVETFPNLADKHDLMLGWFANAMMAMHDYVETKQSASERVSVPVELLERVAYLLELGDMDDPTARELRAILEAKDE